MTFDEYQQEAARNAVFSPAGVPYGVYQALGLNGEAGEVAEKIKKYWRDGTNYHNTREDIRKELGDVLWYLSEVARQWDLKLSDVAQHNVAKLASRRARNVIHGSGDNR